MKTVMPRRSLPLPMRGTLSRSSLVRRLAPLFLAPDWYLCGLVVFVGGLIRWLYLTNQSLWIDESASYLFASYNVKGIITNVLQRDTHPPLYYLIVHVDSTILGLTPLYALRIPSLIFGTLTIAIMYGLGKRLVGRFTGMMAAILTAISPMGFWYSHDGRMYALTWCCVLLSYLLLVVSIQSARWYWVVGFGITVALSLYADISAILGILPQLFIIGGGLIVALVEARSSHPQQATKRVHVWLRVGVGYLGGWALFVPWLLALPQQLGLINTIHFGAPTGEQYWLLVRNVLGLSATYASLDTTTLPVVSVLLLLALGGAAVVTIWAASIRRYRLYGGVVTALTLGSAAVVALLVLHGSRAVLIPRVVGIAAFGVILLASGTLGIVMQGSKARLWDHVGATGKMLSSRVVRIATLLALEGLLLIFVGSTYAAFFQVATQGFNGSQWNLIADEIVQQAQPTDVVIYYPLGIKTIIDPYLPVDSPWRSNAKGLWPQAGHSPEPYFQAHIPGHTHVWFLYYSSSEVNMPLYDTWIRNMGYCHQKGSPSLRFGYVEYVKCAT